MLLCIEASVNTRNEELSWYVRQLKWRALRTLEQSMEMKASSVSCDVVLCVGMARDVLYL